MEARTRLITRLGLAAALIGAAWLLAPAPGAGFRAEDFLDFEYYSRASLREVVTGSHLGMELLRYWRPLADAVTWLIVHGIGPRPYGVHFVLILLHAATAAAAGLVIRRTFGMSVGAACVGALLVLVHPFAPAVLTYLDGGTATMLAALCTLMAVATLGRWREGKSSTWPLLGWTAAAALSYDPALLVAPLLCVVAWLLPREVSGRGRRVPWLLLLIVPAVVGARVLLGVGYRGYALQPDRAMVVELVPRVTKVVARLFAPIFPGELHSQGCQFAALAILGSVVFAALTIAVATRRASAWTAARQAAAIGVLVVGLIGCAPDLVLLNGFDAKPDEIVMAYKTWPAATATALAIAWLLGRAAGRRWWGALALALPWGAMELVLREPIADAHAEALVWAQRSCDGLSAQASTSDAARLLVLEVPVANQRDGRSITRVLQYGVGAAMRPPCRALPIDAYPVFRMAGDSMARYVSQATVDALAASPFLLPVRCGVRPDAPVELVKRPASDTRASGLRLFADGDGRERALAPDLSDAPTVTVDERDEIELFVSGEVSGALRLFVLNRLHPVFVAPAPPTRAGSPAGLPPTMDLVRTRGSGGVDRLTARLPNPAAWFREIATRYPGEVVFLVLEALPDPKVTPPNSSAVTVSNVLPVRLRMGAATGR